MISRLLGFIPVIILIVSALAISVTLTQASIAKAYTVTNVNVCPSPDSVVALGNWQYENVSVSKKVTNLYVTCDAEGSVQGGVYVLSGMPPYPVIGMIPADVFPRDIAFDTTNHKLYVTNYYSDDVSVINPRTNTLMYNIPLGPRTAPYGIAYDHLNERLYVSNEQAQSVSVIDGRTDTVVVPSISVQHPVDHPGHAYPAGVAVDTADNYIYVPDLYGNEVAVIDGGTNSVIAHIQTPTRELTPQGVAYDTVNHRIYVTNQASNSVTDIKPLDNILPIIPFEAGIGYYPDYTAFVPFKPGFDGSVPIDRSVGYIYVSNANSDTISVIRDTDDKVIEIIPLTDLASRFVPPGIVQPNGIAYDPALNGKVYVCDEASNGLSIISP